MISHKAIYKLYPNVVKIEYGVAYDKDNNIVEYNKEEVDALAAEDAQKNAYVMSRLREYPSINDQLDTLYHEGFDAWKSAIKAVKDKYPKPE